MDDRLPTVNAKNDAPTTIANVENTISGTVDGVMSPYLGVGPRHRRRHYVAVPATAATAAASCSVLQGGHG